MKIGSLEVTLVQDAKRAWRWFSVQVSAVIAAAPQVYMQLKEIAGENQEIKWLLHAISIAGILAILGRLIKQGGGQPPAPPAV